MSLRELPIQWLYLVCNLHEGRCPYGCHGVCRKGNIQVNLSPMESRISGTPNNDTYQKFMDEYQKIGKEMNDMYQKIKGDTLLTEVQRDSLMEVLDKKETEGMDSIYQLVSENIASAAGVHLLTMFGSSFEVEKVQPLLEKVPAAFAEMKR